MTLVISLYHHQEKRSIVTPCRTAAKKREFQLAAVAWRSRRKVQRKVRTEKALVSQRSDIQVGPRKEKAQPAGRRKSGGAAVRKSR